MSDIQLAKLEPCVCRFGRRYDGKIVITCGYRIVEVEECLECQQKRRTIRERSGMSTGA